MRDELASDSKIQKGSKQSDVNTARLKGKLPNLIWGGLPTEKKSRKAEVSRSHSSRWSNDHSGRLAKAGYRAKGRTEKKLNRKEQATVRSRQLGGKKRVRTWRES